MTVPPAPSSHSRAVASPGPRRRSPLKNNSPLDEIRPLVFKIVIRKRKN